MKLRYFDNAATTRTKEEVLKEAINTIDKFKPLIDYNYELDDENNYQSWVQSKNLK